MKRIMLAVLLIATFHVYGVTEKKVKSEVKNVTVFTQGAQVFRSSSVTLSSGTTTLVYSGVSPTIQPTSIQAGGKGNFIILEVKHQLKYPEPPSTTKAKAADPEIKLIEDSLTDLGFDEEELAEKKNALLLEKNMIEKNKLAKGEGKSDSLIILKQAMEFFRTKLNDINTQLIRIKRDEQQLSRNKSRMNERLADLRKYASENNPPAKYEPINEVLVTVSAEQATEGTVSISYMVTAAGWTPSYDLRSSTTSSPVELTYKANIFQNTGEAWENVKLKMSTSNPNRSSTKPKLPAWYLNYYYPTPNRNITGNNITNTYDLKKQESKELNDKFDDLSLAESAANYSQIVETMTNVEFDVKHAYSIPSDNSVHVVPIKTGQLQAGYTHYLVPKIESEAFLLARVTGWEELNLLPGNANIFYEGTFVGQTVINPQIIQDTLELSLGRDHGITVTRKRLPVAEKNKFIGNEIVKTITYELKMKNNKAGNINLVVEDQLPLSQNKEIKVEAGDNDGASYNDKTGMLKWNMTLATKENKSLKFSYAVTFNKDMPLSMY